jgi:hypothetical protein
MNVVNKEMSSDYMIIIYTRFVSGSNTKGSRIAAFAPHGRKVEVNKNHALLSDENHLAAAQEWIKKNAQRIASRLTLIGHGDTPTGSGYAFVFALKQEI